MKKGYVYILLCVCFGLISQIYFDIVSKYILYINFKNILLIFLNPSFWIAFTFFVFSSICWIIGIKTIPISKAFSLISLNYIFIYLFIYILYIMVRTL
jgi:hypothetical protein